MHSNPATALWTYPGKSPLPAQVNSVAISDDGRHCVFGTWNEEGSGNFAIYLLDASGKLIWEYPVADQPVDGGVYWTAISGSGFCLAAGGELSKTEGFLRAYLADDKFELLNATMPARVNQVSLNEDGRYLIGCHGSTVVFYRLNPFNMKYEQIAAYDLMTDRQEPYDVISCMISRDGSTAVASGIIYNSDGSTSGLVQAFTIVGDVVSGLHGCVIPSTGCMRVAVVDSGSYWAASLHDGSCALFHHDQPGQYLWKHLPDDDRISLAYAVAVTETDSGQVFLACGANTDHVDHQGLLYLVENDNGQPAFKWSANIALAVNPGVSMDHMARWVTATDGKPNKDHSHESAGSFYLFNSAGQMQWQYPTKLMNWPMMVARNGSRAVGGSDGGMVYCWDLGDD